MRGELARKLAAERGAEIVEQRKLLGVTQAEIARILSLTPAAISAFEIRAKKRGAYVDELFNYLTAVLKVVKGKNHGKIISNSGRNN